MNVNSVINDGEDVFRKRVRLYASVDNADRLRRARRWLKHTVCVCQLHLQRFQRLVASK